MAAAVIIKAGDKAAIKNKFREIGLQVSQRIIGTNTSPFSNFIVAFNPANVKGSQ